MPGFSAFGEEVIGGAAVSAPIVVPPEEPENPPMSFTPSAARTVTVSATGKAFTTQGDFWSMTDPKRPRGPKDPDATTDFTFDWAPWLEDAADSIAPDGLVFLVEEGLLVVGKLIAGTKCTAFVSGGIEGKRARLVCRITTTSAPARTEDRTILLDIEAR